MSSVSKIIIGTPIRRLTGSSTNLGSLNNVTITSPVGGQFLFYDSSAELWRNVTLTEGNGIDLAFNVGSRTFTFTAEYADSNNTGVASFSSSDFSVDSIGHVTINFPNIPESLIPATDSAYDLGSSTKRWKDLYLSGNTIYLGSSQYISVDSGTSQLQFNGSNVVVSGDSSSQQTIRNLFSASGNLSYNATTGAFSYTDSDRANSVIKGLFSAGGDTNVLAYDSATGQFSTGLVDSDIAKTNANEIFHAGLSIPLSVNINFNDATATAKGTISRNASELIIDNDQGIRLEAGAQLKLFAYDSEQLRLTSSGATVYGGVTAESLSISGSGTVDSNLTIGGYLAGPATFVIDPAAVGDATGTVRILGNLTVEGTTTEVNSTTIVLNDKNLVLADSAADSAALDGGGIILGGSNVASKPSMTYSHTLGELQFNRTISADSAKIGNSPVVKRSDTSFIRGLFSDGGGGGLSYNSSTGAFTDSDRSAAQIKQLFTASGSLSYNNSTGAFSYTDSDRSRSQVLGLFTGTGDISYDNSTGVISYTDSDRTASQIKGLFSASGSLSYNSTTGAFSYVDSDRSRAQIVTLFQGGTGITYNSSNGTFSLTGDSQQFSGLTVSNNLTVGGNTTITGNLTVSGTTTTVNSNTVNIGDNILVLNADETGTPSQNAGIEIERGTAVNKSIQWNETADRWYIESDGNGTLEAGLVVADSATVGGQPVLTDGDASFIRGLFSDGGGGGLSYNSSTGAFTDSSRSAAEIKGLFSDGGGGGLSYNSTTGVFTDSSRSASDIKGLFSGAGDITYNSSTGAFSYTDSARTEAQIKGMFSASGGGLSYNSTTGAFTDSDRSRAQILGLLSAGGSLSYNSSTGEFTYTDSDRTASQIKGLFSASSGGLSYNSSTGVFTDSDRTAGQIKGLFSSTSGIINYDNTTGVFSDDSAVFTRNVRKQLKVGGTSLSYDSSTGELSYSDSARSAAAIKGLFSASGSLSYNSSTGAFSYTDSDRTASQIKGLFSASGGGLSYNSTTGAFTDSDRSRAEILGLFSASGSGLSYNSSTGAFTDSDRTRSQILGMFTGGTGVTYNNSTGAISLTGDSQEFSGLTVSNNLTVGGNLVVSGTQTIVNTQNLQVTDPLIQLGTANTSTDVVDIGIIGRYFRNGQVRRTGLVRDASNQQYYLYHNLLDSAFDSAVPPSVIDLTSGEYAGATLNLGKLVADSATVNGNPVLTDADTSFIRGLFSASTGGLSYNSSTGAFTDSDRSASQIKGLFSASGGGLSYNSTTGAFTDSDRTRSQLLGLFSGAGDITYNSSTGAFSYTDSARTESQIKGMFSASGGGLSYNSTTGAFTDSDRSRAQLLGLFSGAGDITYNSSTGEFSYTDSDRSAAQIKGLITVTDAGGDGSLGYNNTTGVITYTGPSASEVRAHFSAGTGVAISSGEISIGQAVATTSGVTFGSATINGTLAADSAQFADNAKAFFGTSKDLSIYHDGSNSYINDAGTGQLTLNTNGAQIALTFGAENMATFAANGAASLYYNNSAKLATTASGIDVTGTITPTSTIDMANNTALNMRNAANSANYRALRVNASNALEVHDAKLTIAAAGAATFASSVQATTLDLTQTTGTAPMTVASTTVVANLNADLLDGQEGSYYRINVYNAAGSLLN